MTRYFVVASINGSGPILCSWPFKRDHPHDCFGYVDKTEAEAFAAVLKAQHPDVKYEVTCNE